MLRDVDMAVKKEAGRMKTSLYILVPAHRAGLGPPMPGDPLTAGRRRVLLTIAELFLSTR